MRALLAFYLDRLAEKRANPHATQELSLRDVLTEVLIATAQLLKSNVHFVGEGKKVLSGKRPDYIVTRGDLPIGYIEAERPDTDLAHLKGRAQTQNAEFIAELDNFLLTNHLDFRLYAAKKVVARVTLPVRAADLTDAHIADWESLFARLLAGEPQPIKNPRDLALVLARRAHPLQRAALEELDDPASNVSKSFAQFQNDLLPNLSRREFADIYAQTLVYGLFAARTLANEAAFDVQSAARAIRAIPLVASLLHDWEFHLPPRLEFELKEIGAVLRRAPMDSIRAYFAKRTGRADPMIDFYEPFLAAYAPADRELRGVYYTPEPVVGFMVRSVAKLLERDFGRHITDHDVQILDPATGTGSFLFATIDEIHRQMAEVGAWDEKAAHDTLSRLFGLELMVAPYTVAHLKIGLQLAGFGTPATRRLNIFLSNTLDDARHTVGSTRELGEEIGHADAFKTKNPILVVLGNPPYSGHSANSNFRMVGDRRQLTEVGERVESYKTVDGAPLGEKNLKWLQDDYVKFIAFAQNRIERTGEGLVAFVTNHGFLDNPTFRGLRASLMASFDALYLLDLHGNSKKQEIAPDGGKDENVFDIQQGVAILFAVKHKEPKSTRGRIFHAALWGTRAAKYEALSGSDASTIAWQELHPSAPFYLFVPRDETLLPEYEQGWKLTDIFLEHSVGITTARDTLGVGWDKMEVWRVVQDFASRPVEDARAHYQLGPDARDWKVELAQKDLKISGPTEAKLQPICYRPFDLRWTYYTGHSRGFHCMPRAGIMGHLIGKENLGLATTRNVETGAFNHVFCSRFIIQHHTVSIKEVNSLFPLYLYSESLFGAEKRPNFTEKFLAEISARAGYRPTSETIFYYLYARLHAPRFRTRYAAFLKTDFPRVPLPASAPELERWTGWGQQLVAFHTLDTSFAPVLGETRFPLVGDGPNRVEKVGYQVSEGTLRFNATRGFKNVPQEVWQWKIGGIQVAKKWLEDRRGRSLDFAELRHFGRTLIALDETRRVLSEIEAFEAEQ